MSSDIKLDKDWLYLEGNWARFRTWDIMLDSPERRSSPQGFRRALVHNHADGLTINYNRDYPGGVEILGNLKIEKTECNGTLQCQGLLTAQTMDVKNMAKFKKLEVKDLAKFKTMVVEDSADFDRASFQQPIQTPDVTITPPAVEMPMVDLDGHVIGTHLVAHASYSLLEKIANLEAEIAKLNQKIAVLEAAIP